MFFSTLTTPSGPGGLPLIRSADEYNATLKKANDIFASVTAKYDSGQALTTEDTKELREAENYFEELNTFNPTRLGPYFAGGRIHLIFGDNEIAAAKFRQAIDDANQPTTDPSSLIAQAVGDSRYYLSICYENMSDFQDVPAVIDPAIKAYPNRGDYLYIRARALVQLKKIPQAIDDLTKAINLNPSDQKSISFLHFVKSAQS
jgi:tetratricopeptide (TPR) repeat protein